MYEIDEFLLLVRLDAAALEAWIEAGWLAPRGRDAGPPFSELDVARARLIRELREDLEVNDEGVAIVLGLIDQIHGLRGALQRLSAGLLALPEPLRRELLAELRGEAEDPIGDGPPGGA